MTTVPTTFLYDSDNVEAVLDDVNRRVYVHTDSLVREYDREWQSLVEALTPDCWHQVRRREYDDPEILGGIGIMVVYEPCYRLEDEPEHSEVCPYRKD